MHQMYDDDVNTINNNHLHVERSLERREVVSILVQGRVLNDGHQMDLGKQTILFTFYYLTAHIQITRC